MKNKPNFLIIGAAKCGTTTLHRALSKHPAIYMALEKDFKFFDKDENYKKGLSYYKNYFSKVKSENIIGEANSEYLFSKTAAQRINKDLGGNVKLIIILRDPAERAFSEYKHQKKYDRTTQPFNYFLDKENLTSELDKELFSIIIERSNYKKHLEPYLSTFSKENIKIVILEKLKENPQRINSVFRFLDVEELDIEKVEQANKAYSPKYKWLNNLILKPNKLRKLFKTLIPSFKIREKIRRGIKSLNIKNSKEETLKYSEKKILNYHYFSSEKNYLENLIDEPINEWHN